jgi:alkaline phosphatase D
MVENLKNSKTKGILKMILQSKSILLLLVIHWILLSGCQQNPEAQNEVQAAGQDTITFAFGSCNRENLPQPLWNDIIKEDPDAWIWLGDNIYGDTQDMDVLEAKYQVQKNNPEYQKMMKTTKIIGTWDDHDYGQNDAGKEYPQKAASQQLMLNFLDVPADASVRDQEGVYQSHHFEQSDLKVKVIMLDTRYFRDPLTGSGGSYVPNPEGDLLGEAQWQWLEKELKETEAQVNIIGSSIQVLSNEHGWEKWGNFPKERQRLFKLIRESKAPGVILLSGDRHIGEFSKMEEGLHYPLYDLTSSGLTHPYTAYSGESNPYRVGEVVTEKHYGLISVFKDGENVKVLMELKGEGGAVYLQEEF